MSVLDKFLDAIRLNDDYEEEDADSDSFFDINIRLIEAVE